MNKITLYSLLFIIQVINACAGIKIKGSNGVEIDFVAVFDARPSGLVVLQNPDSSAITIPWSKIDMNALKDMQPEINEAYLRAVATQNDMPLGLGLAKDMLSLSQLSEALKQAVKDPYYWPYGKPVNYAKRRPQGNTSFTLLKRMRNVQADQEKKIIFNDFKDGGYASYGIAMMIERIDYVLANIPPEKMFPRQPKDLILIHESIRFKKTITEMLGGDTLSSDNQATIRSFFQKLGIE